MSRPKTKAELVKTSEENFSKLLDLVDTVPHAGNVAAATRSTAVAPGRPGPPARVRVLHPRRGRWAGRPVLHAGG